MRKLFFAIKTYTKIYSESYMRRRIKRALLVLGTDKLTGGEKPSTKHFPAYNTLLFEISNRWNHRCKTLLDSFNGKILLPLLAVWNWFVRRLVCNSRHVCKTLIYIAEGIERCQQTLLVLYSRSRELVPKGGTSPSTFYTLTHPRVLL